METEISAVKIEVKFLTQYRHLVVRSRVSWSIRIRIRKVPGSNLVPETGCDFRGFSQFLQANFGVVTQIRPRSLPFMYFQIH
jgi:hypothetical protein